MKNRPDAPRAAGARKNRNLAAEASGFAVRPAGSGSLFHRARTRRNAGANRLSLTVALVPVTLLGIGCGLAAAQRSAAAIVRHERPRAEAFGAMTPDDARRYAIQMYSELIGAPATVADISTVSAYSWRHHAVAREWNVLCTSPKGDYLMRINADSKRLYAVNRMENMGTAAAAAAAAAAAPEVTVPPEAELPREDANQMALGYLKLVGVETAGLTPLPPTPGEVPFTCREKFAQWNFTYRHAVPGVGDRLIKVSVNGLTGQLEHLWNPSSVL